jgi:hypothetical protein
VGVCPIEQSIPRNRRSGGDPFNEIVGGQQLEVSPGPHNERLAVIIAQVDFPIAGNRRRVTVPAQTLSVLLGPGFSIKAR